MGSFNVAIGDFSFGFDDDEQELTKEFLELCLTYIKKTTTLFEEESDG